MSAADDREMMRYRHWIGRIASHTGPSEQTLDWARSLGRQLLVIPAHPDDKLVDLLHHAYRRTDRAVVLVTVVHTDGGMTLRSLAIESEHSHFDGFDCDLPITHATAIGDFLAMISPGVSMTLRIEGDELHARTGSDPVADEGTAGGELLDA